MECREDSPEAQEAKSEKFNCPQLSQTPRKKKKNKLKNKRRFSDEQIRSLESIFESETKLEPRKKLQVARELGLQPRQVAIWFQNKRARWKSKQMEKEYRILRANYDSLASRFESLKKEKQSLLVQLQKLSELLVKPDVNKNSKDLEGSSRDGRLENGDEDSKAEAKLGILHVGLEKKGSLGSKIENVKDIDHEGHEAQELRNMDEYADGSLVLPEKWYGFDAGSINDQSYNSSNWLNFWT
ncbi:hypothetical protein SLEP1_g3212 [Rubroshorea leprosula]|uniref:Homeobox-leucine zipper protein n=1 Tax=Rubroshorea leprosula TaxID=152421 RepID=A0AAV5HQQ0_9ROSI|nr:hypothetical protein SLEP1_g3212 [Rubroshorea leprosula]